MRLFSYQPIPNLPQGVLQEDARAILPETEVFANPAADDYVAAHRIADAVPEPLRVLA